MRIFWCTSCFVGDRSSDALLLPVRVSQTQIQGPISRIFVSGLGLR
jgi:hypothetical protein